MSPLIEQPICTIVGSGRMAHALVQACRTHQVEVHGCFARDENAARNLARLCNAANFGGLNDSITLRGLIFLAVSDDALQPVSIFLAEQKSWMPGSVFVHCSGGLDLGPLRHLTRQNVDTASFHPLQTIPQDATGNIFQGVTISLLGKKSVVNRLERFAFAVGAHPLHITAEDKTRLHIAAVFASNYLAGLMDTASESVSKGKIPPEKALTLLEPLMRNSLDQIIEKNPARALTGPIRRGDAGTVKKHLRQLEKDGLNHIAEAYRNFGLRTLETALKNGELSEPAAEKIKEALTRNN